MEILKHLKLIMILLILGLTVVTSCQAQLTKIPTTRNQVVLDIYLETKCPDTELFIVNQLQNTFNDLSKYLKVYLYPFGKATVTKIGKKLSYNCQHGVNECKGNKILSCVIARTTQDVYVPFTACLIESLDPLRNAKSCMNKYGIDTKAVDNCTTGSEGEHLQYMAYKATDDLRPHLTFVPWIIVNKVFSQTNENKAITDLKHLVCDYLPAREVPACSKYI